MSVDVEAHPEKDNKIFAIGAVRSDSDATFNSACSPAKAVSVAAALNSFACEGRVLLGHNLKRHDIRLLREQIDPLKVRKLETLGGTARKDLLREILEKEGAW